ncbi:DUF2291 family protein [Cryobacterium glaciale]|uniref:DUF2291 family protein n=1 Tax=Cryobacterium glaciale TaxID=1259145 RepID=A0A4R8UVT3_9MICO|nr:DUF2291 family protein [Cryobacterium glaciale]TFB71866.1 DUF2291 family protein [Cryobacterium glaciale]
MSSLTARRKWRTILVIALPVVLIGLMAANTKVLTADEVAKVNPAAFDAAVYAADEYPGIVTAVKADAVDLALVAQDPATAGDEYGNLAGTDKYAIPVTLTGTVNTVDANFIALTVDGLPDGSDVRVSIGQAINGTALRDVTGTTKFADFQNQTDYQQVANEYKALTLTAVVADLNAAALSGTEITVVGIVVTNSGPDGTYLITPVSIEGIQP